MCLIIENKTKQKLLNLIDEKTIQKQIEINPDGYGIVFFNKDKKIINSKKGFGISSFFESLETIEKIGFDYYIHFRKATVGLISIENTHPFDVLGNGSLFLMHNGTIPGYENKKDCLSLKESDTKLLSNEIKILLKNKSIQNKSFKRYIENKLGCGRAVLISSNDSIVLNEKFWINTKTGLKLSKKID